MDIRNIYHRSVPDWLLPFLEVPEMQRLKDIGMNCGCEYTGFPEPHPAARSSARTTGRICSFESRPLVIGNTSNAKIPAEIFVPETVSHYSSFACPRQFPKG